MKKLIAALTLGIAGTCSAATSVVMPTTDIDRGEQIATQVCAACHGIDGNSAVPEYPRLAGQHAKYTYKQLLEFKSKTRENAIMYGIVTQLNQQDMADVSAYYATKKSGVSLADPSTVGAARKLYLGGDGKRGIIPCAGCHGPSGQGNMYAPFPKLSGQHQAYLESQLRAFRAAGREDNAGPYRRNSHEGMMQSVSKELSDKEITILSNFLSGLHD